MSETITQAKATVRITLLVEAGSRWGDEITVGQVHEQAKTAAITRISQIIRDQKGMAILGTPEVSFVTHDRKQQGEP